MKQYYRYIIEYTNNKTLIGNWVSLEQISSKVINNVSSILNNSKSVKTWQVEYKKGE